MRQFLLGLLLALLAAYPPLPLALVHLARAGAVWAVWQPAVWAFAGGLLAGPYFVRRFTRRTS